MKSLSFPSYEMMKKDVSFSEKLFQRYVKSKTQRFYDRVHIIALFIVNALLVFRLLGIGNVKEGRNIQSLDLYPKKTEGKRVAVVIAGTLQRFQLNATIEHLLKPMAKQGHSVDYFVSLTTAWAKAYRDDLGYMDKVHWDPLFSNGKILKKPPNEDTVEKVTRRSIIEAGGRLKQLTLRETIDIDHDKQLKAKREIARFYNPFEDPDARFPLKDVRNEKVVKRTTNGNKNILRLMLSIHQLWNILRNVEQTMEKPYDYVFFLRDDTLWLEDIDFDELIKGLGKKDAVSLSCDARDPPMHPCEINDHGILITRNKAKVFGEYYSEMFKADLNACADQLGSKMTLKGLRGCNSEMLLKWILQKNDIKVHQVGQGQLPFQRSLNVIMPNGEFGHCFHKYCQSKTNKLGNHGLVKCTDISYPKKAEK